MKPHAGVNDGVIDDMNDIEPTYEIVNGTFPLHLHLNQTNYLIVVANQLGYKRFDIPSYICRL